MSDGYPIESDEHGFTAEEIEELPVVTRIFPIGRILSHLSDKYDRIEQEQAHVMENMKYIIPLYHTQFFRKNKTGVKTTGDPEKGVLRPDISIKNGIVQAKVLFAASRHGGSKRNNPEYSIEKQSENAYKKNINIWVQLKGKRLVPVSYGGKNPTLGQHFVYVSKKRSVKPCSAKRKQKNNIVIEKDDLGPDVDKMTPEEKKIAIQKAKRAAKAREVRRLKKMKKNEQDVEPKLSWNVIKARKERADAMAKQELLKLEKELKEIKKKRKEEEKTKKKFKPSLNQGKPIVRFRPKGESFISKEDAEKMLIEKEKEDAEKMRVEKDTPKRKKVGGRGGKIVPYKGGARKGDENTTTKPVHEHNNPKVIVQGGWPSDDSDSDEDESSSSSEDESVES